MTLLKFAQRLCEGITGSKCNAPQLSSWWLVAPRQINVGFDAADVSSGGAGALFPVNAKVYGSYFTTGLERNAAVGGMSAQLTCYGGGAGLGAGWSIPFVAASATGKLTGISKKLAESLGGGAQGTLIDLAKGGWSGATRLVAGPDSTGDLALSDFRDAFATVFGLGANFVVNGASAQLIIFSKKQPVLAMEDMIHANAIGLMAGVGFAVSLDLEANVLVYKTRISGSA